MLGRVAHYLKEVRIELGKVNWPTREQTVKYTLAVITLSLFFALFFAALDYVFTRIINTFVI
jgi:preprotein translocase subunit SecE